MVGTRDEIRRIPHQQVQNRPHDAEQPPGRGERRLSDECELRHGVFGQQRGETADRERYGKAEQELLPF